MRGGPYNQCIPLNAGIQDVKARQIVSRLRAGKQSRETLSDRTLDD